MKPEISLCEQIAAVDYVQIMTIVVSGGYKGYGLGALVEIFCGILGGAHWGPHVRKWMSTARDADLVCKFFEILNEIQFFRKRILQGIPF